MLEAFCLEYYGSAPSIPPQLVVPPAAGDTTALEEFLSDRRGSRVEVRTPARGEKRRLQELADQNAQLALESDLHPVRAEAPAPGRGARGAPRVPEPREPPDPDRVLRHLEHPGRVAGRLDGRLPGRGAEEGALPEVRRAGASTGPDDFAAIAEVVSRRFARLGRRDRRGVRRVVRGGPEPGRDRRRQGPALGGARGDAGVRPAARRGHLAREEGGASSCRAAPTRSCSPRDSAGLQLLQRIRDEAHRFALGFHRQRRETRARGSIFDDLQGVGPARRRALLQHFGSAERLLEATEEELEGVPGVPAKTARAIYAQLHRAGQGMRRSGALLSSRRARARRLRRRQEHAADDGRDGEAADDDPTSRRSGQGRDRRVRRRRAKAGDDADADAGGCSRSASRRSALGPTLGEFKSGAGGELADALGGFGDVQGDRLGAAHAGVRDRRDRRPASRSTRLPLRLEGDALEGRARQPGR